MIQKSKITTGLLGHVYTFFVLFQFFFSFKFLFAGALIFEMSDEHSALNRMPVALSAMGVLRKEFLSKDPSGKVILAINGDFAGASPWAYHRGQVGYDALSALKPHYEVILNLGNHEAFDWGGELGNRLFVEQNQLFPLTTANVISAEEFKYLFEPYRDVRISQNHRVRFVGLVLDDFFDASTYCRRSDYQIISSVSSIKSSARKQLIKAAQDRVSQVVFLCHEYTSIVKTLMEELQDWQLLASKNHPEIASVKLNLIFSGHDHQRHEIKIKDALLLDARSNFDFWAIYLDDQGNISKYAFYDLKEQNSLATTFKNDFPEYDAISKLEIPLVELSKRNNKTLGITKGFKEIKVELKKQRQVLGTQVANALRDWSQDALTFNGQVKGYLGWYNSSSYRRDDPISQGTFTIETILSIYPMPGNSRLVILKGSDIQTLYKALRVFREKEHVYTPQLSDNLVEGEDHQLLILDEHNRYTPLDPNAKYALALDKWLGANGYKLPEWDTIFARAHWIKPKLRSSQDVLIRFLPKYLENPSCPKALIHVAPSSQKTSANSDH